ncbi:hypothetical protein AAHH80_34030, partial [Burkholderia pseudomallei]
LKLSATNLPNTREIPLLERHTPDPPDQHLNSQVGRDPHEERQNRTNNQIYIKYTSHDLKNTHYHKLFIHKDNHPHKPHNYPLRRNMR